MVVNVAAGDTALLQVNDLHTDITTRQGVVHAVSGVSLCIDAGETVGLVGESGCGKTMTAMSLVRLLPGGAGITSGSIKLDGRDLVPLADSQVRSLRGSQIGVVFQDPMTSLNPTMAIGHQIGESFRLHRSASRRQARSRALEVLGLVGMPRPSERLGEYPHQLSGGMRQRVMIALALVCEPKLLIADEPTTALDATIQAQILELLDNLRQRLGMGMLLVTHDMGVIAGHANRVLVMYAGKIVESAPTEGIFADPRHRYTEALLKSVPSLDQDRSRRLSTIPGTPPDLSHPLRGCSFAPRCSFATDQCNESEPILDGETEAHRYACYHPRSTTAASVTEPASHKAGRSQRLTTLARESPPILSLASVSRRYPVGAGVFRRGSESIKAVSDVSLTVAQGETFGLVGESGCGKSTLGQAHSRAGTPRRGLRADQRYSIRCPLQAAATSKTPRRAARLSGLLQRHEPEDANRLDHAGPATRPESGISCRAEGASDRIAQQCRPAATCHGPFPARAIRRATATGWLRPRPYTEPQAHSGRRTSLGARCFGTGADHQPDAVAPIGVQPHLCDRVS